MDPQHLIPGDATLIENIVNFLKAKGIFDEFRHECLADVDTKSSCQNLSQRVDGYTSKFLGNETWHPDSNKNELRNKLRRHIDESGMLAVGADHVVEQVINPKIHQFFLPKIIEVVHQYVKEQSELFIKKPETTTPNENTFPSEKPASDMLDNKDKTSISDPIADILSFSYSKPKPMPVTNIHIKTENVQHKSADLPKVEKKKEEKCFSVTEKNTPEVPIESPSTSLITEAKPQIDKEKEKIKKEEQENLEASKKTPKEEVKSEKKKAEDAKSPFTETTTSHEEIKTNTPTSIKPTILSKKDFDKNKLKSKSSHVQKSSNNVNEIKKSKKESSDKSSEKHVKSKSTKSPKESPSPTKNVTSMKSMFKEEKGDKSKSYDSSSSKTSDSSVKKSKYSGNKKDNSSKHKGHSEKTDRSKISKPSEKIDLNVIHDSSNNEKSTKSMHYSSSYDSSQGSDQEKSSSSSKKEKHKHFSKHVKKEKLDHDDNINKMLDKKRIGGGDESPSKKYKNEKDSKLKLKDTAMIEAAKISSRSNSFGSTSSVSSLSNTSKDNLTSNSDEVSEGSTKDKKKKQIKEKDSCQNSLKTLPPPPPPPPPSSSLSCELTSSAEMSSVEDTQSSSSSETSSSEEISEESSSDSELESKDLILNTLNESMFNSSTDNINAFYDIFLYSSSSSEFEGYENSPDKKKFQDISNNIRESDVSISSVHTSDLSSFDDELSSDDDVYFLTGDVRKRLTLKEAQELLQNRAVLQNNKNSLSKNKVDSHEISPNRRSVQISSSVVSSDEELSPSEPKRSLRRERKLNPRYASSEYTSIFNSRKETFITKQSSPSVKSNSLNSSPNTESLYRKMDSLIENDKLSKKSLVQNKLNAVHQDTTEMTHKKMNLNTESQDEVSNSSGMSSSDEIDSILDQENKTNDITDSDKLKACVKLKAQNNSKKLNRNSHSLKRKLEITDSTPVKRPCSRSSVDSSSSELVPNENKPFNSEKQSFPEEKILKDSNLRNSDLIGEIKDLFCKQRTNNNGDILAQKDIFSKNSHGKTINSEKKTSDSDTSKELNSL